MCLYPQMVRNPKYKPNKKNGGQMPAVSDERVLFVPIACGKCIECLKRKSNEWKIRMMEDIKTHTDATFVTLTFSNKSYKKLADEQPSLTGYELDNWIATRAVRLFTERWRKHHKKTIRHWLVTELGHVGTERIHLHGLIWSKNKIDIVNKWQYGYVYCGDYVNEKTISYITKYITKTDFQHKTYRPLILTSNGIGGGYTNSANFQIEQV